MNGTTPKEKQWFVLEGQNVSPNLVFLCKHFWNVHYVCKPHTHLEYELIYIVGGEGELASDNINYRLAPGDLLVVEPGETHTGSAHPENPFEMLTLGYQFNARRLYADPALFGLDQVFLHLLQAYKKKYKRYAIHDCGCIEPVLTKLLEETIHDRRCRKELMRAYLIEFFTLMIRKIESLVDLQAESLDSVEAIIRAKRFIQSNFHKPINLEEIADAACLSKSHFCRVFKEETGFTPIEYVNFIRLEKAMTLLWYSNYTLTEIAEHVGFSSIHYFSRSFKKHNGVSPLQYRQQKMQSDTPSGMPKPVDASGNSRDEVKHRIVR